MRSRYVEFMNEYESLGHMSRVNELLPNETYYFFPHHGVMNGGSVSTKLRVVFDGSWASDNDIPLNDILLVGSTIQDDLLSIILRLKRYRFVMCAVVEKMYMMVEINPNLQPLQKNRE
ncbi:hypothetical protein JTB14_026635 [Gonioctena quinquepunctata]|nr:hypothetical protein JTB14_026635 [Gonioctena quinquepunctata]